MRSKVPMVATTRVVFLAPIHRSIHDLAWLPLKAVRCQTGKASGVVYNVPRKVIVELLM